MDKLIKEALLKEEKRQNNNPSLTVLYLKFL